MQICPSRSLTVVQMVWLWHAACAVALPAGLIALAANRTSTGGTPASASQPPASVRRGRRGPRPAPLIPIDQLLLPNPTPAAGPVDDHWLGPPSDALPPSNGLAGRLVLLDTSNVGLEVLTDTFDYARFPTRQRLPPGMAVEYCLLDGVCGASQRPHRPFLTPYRSIAAGERR